MPEDVLLNNYGLKELLAMQANRDAIVKFCEQYLNVEKCQDFCKNGLQVEGCEKVERIVTGVSFSLRLVEAAVKTKSQMVIVHHGIFNNHFDNPPVIKGFNRDRLKLLLSNDISLCGFHLPLDVHPLIGNNISLCRLLGVAKAKPFEVGFIGELSKPVDFKIWLKTVEQKLGAKAFAIAAGPAKCRKIAIISGAASQGYVMAAELGADTYICGNIREEQVRSIEETGINFINAGHYNTEKLGVQNLGRLIAKQFKVSVEFIDIPCSI
jgi:dinuclear metal center YbgI/SA1388 family protein